MSRAEQSAINQARDEHLRLALPGWGAPGSRFSNVAPMSRVEHAQHERERIEGALLAESDVTLRAITITDVLQKFGTSYSRARYALANVRMARGLPLSPHGGLRAAA